MAINIQNIKNLPKHFQVIIALLPPIILIILFFFLVYSPKDNEVTTLNARIIKLDEEIVSSEENIKRLDALIAENTLLKERLSILKQQLPEEKEVSVLLKQISELGLRSGLEILLWKPEEKKTSPEGLYVEIPVKVEVLTGYHRLGVFFSHISRLPRLVNITDIKLVKKKGGQEKEGFINADFTARTFASVDPQSMIEEKGKEK